MKRILFLLAIQLPIYALYIGNPASPNTIQQGLFLNKENILAVQAGYQRDWNFDRNMQVTKNLSGHNIDDFRYIADQGTLTFNIIKHIELYGSAGAMRITTSHNPMSTTRNQYQSHDQLTWGIGARALFAQWKKLSFALDGKYQRAHPTIKWMTSNGTPIQPRTNSKISYHEWQVSLGMTGQIALFYPYIALKYSSAHAHFKNLPSNFLPNTRNFTTKNRHNFGLGLGSSLSNSSLFSATVEARLIDEQAITLSGKLQF